MTNRSTTENGAKAALEQAKNMSSRLAKLRQRAASTREIHNTLPQLEGAPADKSAEVQPKKALTAVQPDSKILSEGLGAGHSEEDASDIAESVRRISEMPSAPVVDENFESLIKSILAGEVVSIAAEMARYLNQGTKEQKERITAALDESMTPKFASEPSSVESAALVPVAQSALATPDEEFERAFSEFGLDEDSSETPLLVAGEAESTVEVNVPPEAEESGQAPMPAPAGESAIKDMVTKLFSEQAAAVVAENATLKARNATLETENKKLIERAEMLDLAIASAVSVAQGVNLVPDLSSLEPMEKLTTLLSSLASGVANAVANAQQAAQSVLAHETEFENLFGELEKIGEPEELGMISASSARSRMIDAVIDLSPDAITAALTKNEENGSLFGGADVPSDLDVQIEALQDIIAMGQEVESQCVKLDDGSLGIGDTTRKSPLVKQNALVQLASRIVEMERATPDETSIKFAISVVSKARSALPILLKERAARDAANPAESSEGE